MKGANSAGHGPGSRPYRIRTRQWIEAATVAGAAMLAASTAHAFWELTPIVQVGITGESNPRYRGTGGDNVKGTYSEVAFTLLGQTPANEVRLRPRIRQSNYLESNQDLNDDDFFVDLYADHEADRGRAGITLGFQDISIRTGEFEGATPDDPDSNPVPGGGSGTITFADDSQQTVTARPFIEYFMSPRNSVQVNADFGSTEYDAAFSSGYYDYSFSSGGLRLVHSLNEKNAFLIGLNASSFNADRPNTPFENNSDSYGFSVAYQRALTETWSADVNLGTARSTVAILNPQSFNPDTGIPCFPVKCRVSDQNFVGDLTLRKRAERSTINVTVARVLAPRSDGSEVVQDRFRVYVDQRLTRLLTGSVAFLYLNETSVADVFRRERDYFTVDTRLTRKIAPNWSIYGAYSYVKDRDKSNFNFNLDETNNRVFIGISWQGTGWRW